jgi:cytochrome c biogenesis protein CcdA
VGARRPRATKGFDGILAVWLAIGLVTVIGAQGYLRADRDVALPDWSALPDHGRGITGAHAIYLYSPGCSGCTQANDAYREVATFSDQLRIAAYDLSDPVGWAEAQSVQTELARVHKVPPIVEADIPPALFTPSHWFVGDESTAGALTSLGRAEPGALATFESPVGRGNFELALGGLTMVAAAGLADGLNPCALAGLAFLCAYLLNVEGSPRRALVGGLLFCLGTFAAYFTAGMGLYFVVAGSAAIPGLRLLVYGVATVCAVVFALKWWWQVAEDESHAVVSAETRRVEHSLVRRAARSKLLWLAAPALGAAFALLELACTGQVYLPAIAVLARQGEFRQALPGLTLYNLAFVVPAVALTVAVAMTGQALSAPRFKRWARGGRLAVAAALTGLALFLGSEVWHAAQAI